MRLYIYCKNCEKEHKTKLNYISRWEMPKQMDMLCKHCGCVETYNADNVYAKPIIGNTFIYITLLFFTVGCMVFLFDRMRILVVGFTLPSLLYAIYVKEELKKVNLFNSTKVNNKINTK